MGRTASKERTPSEAKQKRKAEQDRRAEQNRARKKEGGTTRWEQAKAERRIARLNAPMQQRNPRGFILKSVDGHQVLVADTAQAHREALVRLSVSEEERLVIEFEKDQARKKARQRKPAPKPGAVTVRNRKDAK